LQSLFLNDFVILNNLNVKLLTIPLDLDIEIPAE